MASPRGPARMKTDGMANFQRVASVSELPPGGRILTEIDGLYLGVFNVDGEYYAIEDVCTHDDGPVADGELDGYSIECPRHGACFDIRTGKVLRMPAVTPIAAFPVVVDGDDVLVDLGD